MGRACGCGLEVGSAEVISGGTGELEGEEAEEGEWEKMQLALSKAVTYR